MTEQLEGQISIFDLGLPFSKTCPEHSQATRGRISAQSSRRFVQSGGGRNHIVPMPPSGKWLPSGCIVGDGWSVAWNVYDAQRYVPQRRKRIYLVADFAGERAGKILFESESVSGDSQPGETPWESFARHHAGSAGGSGFVFDARGNGGGYISPTITGDHENRVTDYTAVSVELCFGGTETNAAISSGDKAQCLTARAGTGGGERPDNNTFGDSK